MALTIDEVNKVAHLARLSFSEEELPQFTKTLSNILDLVAEMNAADTTDITPMAHPQDVSQVMREDKITETNQRELMQTIAPKTVAGLYLVPQVIVENTEDYA